MADIPPRRYLALLASREGLPLGHWLYPGRQSDVRIKTDASREFHARPGLGSFVLVADRGMVSAANLQALREERIEDVIAEGSRQSTARAGKYKAVTRSLEVKETKADGAERVPVCRNLEHTIEDARCAAKWTLRTATSLPPQQVALTYRVQWLVEPAFRSLKTPLELRWLSQTGEASVPGHAQTCELAYALVRINEDRLDLAGLFLNAENALHDPRGIQRAPLYGAGITITKTTPPSDHQKALPQAVCAPILERHTALQYEPKRRCASQTRFTMRSVHPGAAKRPCWRANGKLDDELDRFPHHIDGGIIVLHGHLRGGRHRI